MSYTSIDRTPLLPKDQELYTPVMIDENRPHPQNAMGRL
jgi:hypothetical protein